MWFTQLVAGNLPKPKPLWMLCWRGGSIKSEEGRFIQTIALVRLYVIGLPPHGKLQKRDG